MLDDGADEARTAALAQLPAGLEHLCISNLYHYAPDLDDTRVQFPAGVLQHLHHLTHLELRWGVVAPDTAGPALQPLQAFTRLVELEIGHLDRREVITSSMLSGMQCLTRLELSDEVELEPGALSGTTQLQHLCLKECVTAGGAAGVAQLLLRMQPLQQLTHLSMSGSLLAVEGSKPPAEAYAALTASSKLQHLDISRCTLPTGVWQHMFPVGRQLPNLQSLIIDNAMQPSGQYAEVPEGSRLVSCCPGLQSLHMGVAAVQCRAADPTSGAKQAAHTGLWVGTCPGRGCAGGMSADRAERVERLECAWLGVDERGGVVTAADTTEAPDQHALQGERLQSVTRYLLK